MLIDTDQFLPQIIAQVPMADRQRLARLEAIYLSAGHTAGDATRCAVRDILDGRYSTVPFDSVRPTATEGNLFGDRP